MLSTSQSLKAKMSRGGGGGRIHVHQRDTDDTVPIIGADIAIKENHAAAAQTTQSKGMKDKTRKEHRNRHKHMMEFWREHYGRYFEQGTYILTDEQKADPTKYYFQNDRDLHYRGLNVKMVIAHCSNKKFKPNGKLIGPSDLSKYGDAIKWGATMAGEVLPTEFYVEFENFITSYKKEYSEAKKEGKVDEKAADPINAGLFTKILQWAVASLNIFVWVYALLMWHLMARSISISSLGLHNMKVGSGGDSLAFKFDNSKTDQTGEFVQEKNCYANPKQAVLCLYLALGCWISMKSEEFETRETLFEKSNTKNGTAAQNFCRQLSALVKKHAAAACKFLRLSRFHAHGIRKGSGSHASSATTVPPQFTSVAARGEWSMGKILDIYFQFAMGGDYYLGRLLTLIPPEDKLFDSLPPHWKDQEHPTVAEALKLTFGKALTSHQGTENDPTGVFSFLLASMVHHSNWLLKQVENDPKHPFSNIPLLHNPDLLKELKEKHLTLEPTDEMKAPSGVPPFVQHNRLLDNCHQLLVLNAEALSKFRDDIKDAVADAVDKKVAAEGGVNSAILAAEMEKLKTDMREMVGEILTQTPADSTAVLRRDQSEQVDPTIRIPGQTQFSYTDNNGITRGTCIPPTFEFPSEISRFEGWRKWLCGQTFVYEGVKWQLPPFRHLKGTAFAPDNRRILNSEWKPIFKKMMEAPGLEIPEQVTDDFIHVSFELATRFLKQQYSYIFKQPPDQLSAYKLGTWSKKIKRSEVEKYGTEEDKQKLPPPTAGNKKRARKESSVTTHRRKRRIPLKLK